MEYFRYLLALNLAIDLFVYHHNRRKAAAAEASYNIKMKEAVFGGFALVYLKQLFDFIYQIRRSLQVARRSETNGYVVLAGRLQLEIVVEGDDFIYSRERNIEGAGKLQSRFSGT